MHLAELKKKSPADLLADAEELQIENASSMRKQDIIFAILKTLADNDQAIFGEGTLEILPDGFGFLRSPEASYLPGPDDIYISPAQVRRYGLRGGTRLRVRFAHHGMVSVISRSSKSMRSILKVLTPSVSGSTSIT